MISVLHKHHETIRGYAPVFIFAMFCFFLLHTSLLFGQDETETVVPQAAIAEKTQESTTRFDLMGVAIVSMSLGGMASASGIHYLHHRKKAMNRDIARLTDYIATSTSVAFSLNVANDQEPRTMILKALMEQFEKKLVDVEARKTETLRGISESEDKAQRYI